MGSVLYVNPRIFVFAAVAALAAILGAVLFASSTIFESPEESPQATTPNPPVQMEPISVELDDISILQVDDRFADIEIRFNVRNPNPTLVLVQVMDYQLYETGFSEDVQVSGGQIGSRPGGMIEFGNNYYTLLGENSLLLKDKVVLKNTGNAPELWSALEENTARWKVTGDVFYNLSSMTSGQENEFHFEFRE